MEALETIGYIPAPTGPIRALTNGFDRLQGSLFFRGHQYNEGDSGSQVDVKITLESHAFHPSISISNSPTPISRDFTSPISTSCRCRRRSRESKKASAASAGPDFPDFFVARCTQSRSFNVVSRTGIRLRRASSEVQSRIVPSPLPLAIHCPFGLPP